ncbi:DNA-dependent RNA polymerase subunit epsilon [Bacillus sp. FJAT-44742]|uniref:DNA-dependent RNA polymerase subunit epsilon n=1 Tax=Bacillus sp. FJAT-44742 TaxID=2014005 RepID=UPI000C24E018|nr:DNA-directed RNA polymerase subunit epsilon [Bacillus sp. FJAT-44742]
MIFKVFYQENIEEAPVRENTHSLFVEAESEREVRQKLADRKYNIELVQEVSGDFLEYEKQREDFKVENI